MCLLLATAGVNVPDLLGGYLPAEKFLSVASLLGSGMLKIRLVLPYGLKNGFLLETMMFSSY